MTIQTAAHTTADANTLLKVERPFYEQQQFNSALNYDNSDDDQKRNCSQWMYNIKPCNIFLSIFPLFGWLSRYSVKNDLLNDIISGCTVAIMHIPQGISDFLFFHKFFDLVIEIFTNFVDFFFRNGIRNVGQHTTNHWHLHSILSRFDLLHFRHIETQFDGDICRNFDHGWQIGAEVRRWLCFRAHARQFNKHTQWGLQFGRNALQSNTSCILAMLGGCLHSSEFYSFVCLTVNIPGSRFVTLFSAAPVLRYFYTNFGQFFW